MRSRAERLRPRWKSVARSVAEVHSQRDWPRSLQPVSSTRALELLHRPPDLAVTRQQGSTGLGGEALGRTQRGGGHVQDVAEEDDQVAPGEPKARHQQGGQCAQARPELLGTDLRGQGSAGASAAGGTRQGEEPVLRDARPDRRQLDDLMAPRGTHLRRVLQGAATAAAVRGAMLEDLIDALGGAAANGTLRGAPSDRRASCPWASSRDAARRADRRRAVSRSW